MIGDGYFQLRAQIGTSLFSLAKLGRDLEAPEPALASLQGLQAGLREAFLFLTLGPSRGGKSTLLNALFGREFAGGPAFTGRAVVFRHSPDSRDVPLTEELVEAERPHIFLRDFTLVDMPGFDSPSAAPDVLKRFLPNADLVLFVFPVKGDGAEAWDFLASIDRDVLRRFIFIIQQCDTASPDEVLLYVKRLRHTMLTRLGHACPIFMVSAQTRAGLEKLERYIDGEIIASASRRQKLRDICTAALRLLGDLADQPRAAIRNAEQAGHRVEEQRLTLVERKDQSLRQSAGELWSLAQTFDAAQSRGEQILLRRLKYRSLVRERTDWQAAFQREVDERLHDAIAKQLETTFEHINTDLQDAWESHRAVLEKLDAKAPPTLAQDRSALLDTFSQTLAVRDREAAIMKRIAQRYREIRAALRLPVFAVLASALLVLTALLTSRFVAASVALFVVTAGGAGLAAFLLRRSLFSQLQALIAKRREKVIAGIENGVRAEINRFYRELVETLRPLDEARTQQRAQLQPTLARVQQLDELFAQCMTSINARHASLEPAPEESVPNR
ncbi:MAG: hypothetical protein QOE70_3214 [Chthoniobacter sp.]|jgi:hypothetical protein|nr:hypothetical protein [Chthoniobacter sp.]